MSTRDIVYIALFAAITAALGLFPAFSLPVIAVPITAQTLGPMLAGAIAGAKRGALALVLFVVLVAIGLPLLAGGRGGLGIFLGPSGGFILAWPLAALLIGFLYQRNLRSLTLVKEVLFLVLGGVVLIYSAGIPWIAAVAGLSLKQAALGSLGFLPGDIVKVVLAVLIIRAVRRAYPTL
ncbi:MULTISPECIES: biotin transporter BioY [Erwiniaceae]|uniref:Biotin transporter BioY n=2 Tax=Erwiniaceae TaxID=1903409 RepID=A0ACC5RJL8_ENTAG|nr:MULTISPECIES: biotin transporter BioY [Erwiniaceae]MBK4724837.1 biotin transporter BioY [Pantoea agglomerans]MBP2152583.1 biotin transport system substrate-specific component [Erwinia rhapontici]MCS3607923.1 biotin transport system substrate-specific component [Erwinia rhapontici]NKG29042.1 biotin transporter BioY [Erwinia rhapontici]NNS07861.1 biotin transporter BioY [Erwinia sp. JH02]